MSPLLLGTAYSNTNTQSLDPHGRSLFCLEPSREKVCSSCFFVPSEDDNPLELLEQTNKTSLGYVCELLEKALLSQPLFCGRRK